MIGQISLNPQGGDTPSWHEYFNVDGMPPWVSLRLSSGGTGLVVHVSDVGYLDALIGSATEARAALQAVTAP